MCTVYAHKQTFDILFKGESYMRREALHTQAHLVLFTFSATFH